jgi:hypothetical protein
MCSEKIYIGRFQRFSTSSSNKSVSFGIVQCRDPNVTITFTRSCKVWQNVDYPTAVGTAIVLEGVYSTTSQCGEQLRASRARFATPEEAKKLCEDEKMAKKS